MRPKPYEKSGALVAGAGRSPRPIRRFWRICRRRLEPATLGDPMRPLVFVSKSHAKLAAALRGMGHRVSASRIPQLLERLGYRRQVNRKTKARPRKAAVIQTGTLNSSLSTRKAWPSKLASR